MKLKLIIAVLFLFGFSKLNAQLVTGHYGPGLFGLRSAHGFPMGVSYINVTHFYYAGDYKNNDGEISRLGEPINVIANINGATYGKRLEALNANYNAALILPLTNLAPNPENLTLDPDKLGFGDMSIIPLMLTWNWNRISMNTRYQVWLPTGKYKAGAKDNKGKGFWSHNIGLGFTGYFDKEKTWHASLMNTLEINGKQEDTDITAPTALITEWSLGKTFDQAFNMGLVGYLNNQVGNQKGGKLPSNWNNYKVNGIGMELGYRTKSKWAFSTRWYLEYLAKNRPEGSMIRFILVKNF